MCFLNVFRSSGQNIEEPAETVSLDGPFLPEEYIIRHRDKYLDLLKKTVKCNLVLSRDILVLSSDLVFSERDNPRLKVGLHHHMHQLELAFTNNIDFIILAIDRFVILNPSDASILKQFVSHHLPTNKELKTIQT